MMKKWISMILAGMMMLTLLTACGNGGEGGGNSSGSVDIGVVLPTNEEPRWMQDEAQFKEIIAAETDLSVEVLFSQGDVQKERTNVETLISKGIKVLIICPHDGKAAKDAVEAAKAEGVTVIAYDRLINDTDAVDYYCTFDSIAVGEAMGEYLVDQASGSGNNLYLYAGAVTDNNAFMFFEGAWNVLQPKIADGTFVIQNSPDAESLKDTASLTRDQLSTIMGKITTDWDESVAKGLAESNLTAAADDAKGTCYILAPNDPGARSIADVFALDAGVDEYYITGQDAEISSVEYIIDGKQSMTIFKNTKILASDAMELAIAILNGESINIGTDTYDNGEIEVPSKQTEVVSVTKANLREALIDSGYYAEGDIANISDLD